jgi:cell division protein FtsZ
MSFSIVPDRVSEHGTVIKVVGVGGAGGNAINRMIEQGLSGVEFIACNTDRQVLNVNLAPTKIVLGKSVTRGLGAGGDPEVGAAAAEEEKEVIRQVLTGADMVFITAGMGGGTGTGAAPIIAKIAKECGALTLGVVTKPFAYEGKKKMEMALVGIDKLKKNVDTLITIPNEKIHSVLGSKVTLKEAFLKADEILKNGVKSITEIITTPGIINIDFADVRSTMGGKGDALMGIGIGKGENKVAEAVEHVLANPFLDGVKLDGATRVLINVVAPSTLPLDEFNEINQLITSKVHPTAQVIAGLVYNDDLKDEIQLTVIATGFEVPAELDFQRGTDKATEILPGPRTLRTSQSHQPPTTKKNSIFDVYGIESIIKSHNTDIVWGQSSADQAQLSSPTIFRNSSKTVGKN